MKEVGSLAKRAVWPVRQEKKRRIKGKAKDIQWPLLPSARRARVACSKRVRVEEAEEKNLDAVARKIRMLVRKVCERKQKHLRSQNRC